MIVPNENKHTKVTLIIAFIVMIIIAVLVVNAVISAKPYYAAPGSNTETWGAPDGTYEQGDWGCPLGLDIPWGSETVIYGGWYNNVTNWSFAMCDHEGLGPLHGCWPVVNGTNIPVYQEGVFPIDARLYVTIKDNVIVAATVRSHLVYGN